MSERLAHHLVRELDPLGWFKLSRSKKLLIAFSVVETLIAWTFMIGLTSKMGSVQRSLNACRAMTPQFEGR